MRTGIPRKRVGPSLRGECPQITDGSDHYTPDPDGWTLRTASGARAAHSEHTVAVTADGARILTS
jgi:methionyl aminopeptidase